MNKKTSYALTGAIGAGLINAALNAINQHNEIAENPGQEFDWKRFWTAGAKGLWWGGVGGLAIGAIADYNNSLEKPENTDAFLQSLAASIKLNKTDIDYRRQEEKADLVINLIKSKFNDKLASDPLKIGSIVKGTALKGHSDFDIGVTFKRSSFRSTQEMYSEVLSYFSDFAGRYSIIKVRDQKKSVGILFSVAGMEFKIDVVPCRRTSKKGKSTSGYLFLNDSNFWTDNSSWTKTDFRTLSNTKLNVTQKKIVILLKHWKNKNNLPIKSVLLEHLVLDAYLYNKNKIPGKLTDKVIMVTRHIAENLSIARISSVENSNNILTNIPQEDKGEIIEACNSLVQKYEYQPNSIMEEFGIKNEYVI